MRTVISILGLLISAFISSYTSAVTYQTELERSEWLVSTSIYACTMEQSIPDFGSALFHHYAGEKASFRLFSNTPRMKAGEALLTVISPFWKPGGEKLRLGYVDVKEDNNPITLNDSLAYRLMHELYNGRQVEFVRRAWFSGNQPVNVGISNVNFRGAYDQYIECLTQLLPVNFSQVERVALQYPEGRDELDPRQLKKITDVLTFVNAETGIRSLYIDGHTDSRGTRAENLDISKLRAEAVQKILIEGGVDKNQILIRWHGERYPVASNRTSEGRAKNRRVTVRLSKEPLPEMIREKELMSEDKNDSQEGG
jgi:outer membrane protein OmpA-like peptidoglycan-associated protein